MKKPCANCPFLKEGGVPLRLGRIEEIHDVVAGERGGVFPCHKSVKVREEEEDSDDERDGKFNALKHPESSHCAGAIIYSLKLETPNQMTRIGMRLGAFDPDALMMHADKVHDSLHDWIQGDPIAREDQARRDASRKAAEATETGDPCSVADQGCEAPAGFLVGGRVVHGTDLAEFSCSECGEPVCGSCSELNDEDERICNRCLEWIEEDDARRAAQVEESARRNAKRKPRKL